MKKHQCQDCEKGFISKHALDNHVMNVHLKLRPYKCRYGCEFGYNDPANRNSHERKKHGKLYMVGGNKEEIARVMMEEVREVGVTTISGRFRFRSSDNNTRPGY